MYISCNSKLRSFFKIFFTINTLFLICFLIIIILYILKTCKTNKLYYTFLYRYLLYNILCCIICIINLSGTDVCIYNILYYIVCAIDGKLKYYNIIIFTFFMCNYNSIFLYHYIQFICTTYLVVGQIVYIEWFLL